MNSLFNRSSVLSDKFLSGSISAGLVGLFLLFGSGCRTVTQPQPVPPGPPTSLPSAAITGMIPLDCNGNSGDFEVDLFVCDTSGHFIPNLPSNAITILGSLDTLFTQSNVDTMFSDLFGDYSAELLLDQTGSIRTTDPLNLRLIAAKLFLQATNFLAVPNEVQLSTFQDSLQNGVYMQSYGAFTHNTGAFIDTVALFATRVGGGTPLYDAMYNEIDSLANQAHNTNKVLVVFTDGEDNESGLYYPGANLLSVIQHAAQKNVKIFAIALQTGLDIPLIQASMQTGGAVMHTNDAKQMVSYFGALPSMMHGHQQMYRTKWHVSVPHGNMHGQTVTGNLSITLSDNSVVIAPFAVTFQ